ncbi:ribosomal L7Ae/L30e/S12e/Gadd45 family protein [Candidatus Woesearchaeota archaeon]|nr:ribosomal L7Ae/L30e/S12e/Gadd45 family protein [Candidatus Woesearchaeota archaeon]
MAQKKAVDEDLKLLKEKSQTGKALLGKEEVLRGLRKGLIKKVFLSSNCQREIKSDVLHFSKLAGAVVVELSLNNEELGVLCKKSYFISVAGILDA